MQPNTAKHVYWSYSYKFQGQKDFPDPRIAIARQISWKKSNTEFTEYSIPEPDNYNRAIFMTKSWECPLIEDQVIYYDEIRNGWITIMYVPIEQIIEVDRWILNIYPMAQWRHTKPPKVKQQRGILWARDNKSSKTLTDNERLYTMGYFENLKIKYFNDDTEYIDSLLGESRDSLKNFVPEEQGDIDDYDNSSMLFN